MESTLTHHGKNSISILLKIFSSTDRVFISGGGGGEVLGNNAMTFWDFPESLLSHSETRETTWIYQFISNNHASFLLWWTENLLNHQKSQNIMNMIVGEIVSGTHSYK